MRRQPQAAVHNNDAGKMPSSAERPLWSGDVALQAIGNVVLNDGYGFRSGTGSAEGEGVAHLTTTRRTKRQQNAAEIPA